MRSSVAHETGQECTLSPRKLPVATLAQEKTLKPVDADAEFSGTYGYLTHQKMTTTFCI